MSRPSIEDRHQATRFHPYLIILVLLLTGITTLFIAFSIAYIYTRFQYHTPPIPLPNIFILNTLVLLASSYTIQLGRKYFREDNTEAYKRSLLITILLSLLFLGGQIFGWSQLLNTDWPGQSANSRNYLYVISLTHFAHLLAGLPFLVSFYLVARRKMVEPMTVLLYFSDPVKALYLRMLTWYWHFIDFLWIYLVAFFWLHALLG